MVTPRPRPLTQAALCLVAGLLLEPPVAAAAAAPTALLIEALWPAGRAAARGLLLGVLLAISLPTPVSDAPAGLPRAAVLVGRVRSAEPPSRGQVVFVLDAELARHAETDAPFRARVEVTVERAHALAPAPGDRVEVALLLRAVPEPRNPGERDARPWHARRGVDLLGRAPHARCVTRLEAGRGPSAAIARLRGRAARALDRSLPPDDAGLARGLLLGDRGAIAQEDRAAFRASGQSHLVAVSGQHVVLVLGALLLLGGALGLSSRTTTVLGLLAVLVYVPLAGAAPSAVRSGLAAVLWLAGRLLLRSTSTSSTLSAAALAMLVAAPEDLGDPGFTLSFAAVLGIELLAPRFEAALAPPPLVIPGLVEPRRPRVRAALCVALAAWAAGAPLALHAFGQVCLVAAPLSLLAVPLAAVLLALAALLVPWTWLGLPPAPLAVPFGLTADLLREVLAWPERLGLGNVSVTPPGDLWLAAAVAALLLAGLGPRRALRWALLALAALGLHALSPRAPPPPLRPTLDVLDLHRDVALALRLPDGRALRVEPAGGPTTARGRRVRDDALRALGVDPAAPTLDPCAWPLPEPLVRAVVPALARRGRGSLRLELGERGRWTPVRDGPSRDAGGYDLARVTPLPLPTLVWFAAALAVFAAACVRPLAWLRPGGAAGAWVLGVAVAGTLGGAGFAALFAPFVVATLLGKLPGASRDRGRTLRQVASNGLPALVGAALAAAGLPLEGAAFLLGGLACLGADTCATEIGTRYGGTPRSLVTGRALARGESGGVTRAGLLASLGGALLAPGAWASIETTSPCAVLWLGAAGAAGALLDSVLGATLQYRGRRASDGAVVEARHADGAPTARVRGLRWLDNDAVNLVAGLASGALALLLLRLAR